MNLRCKLTFIIFYTLCGQAIASGELTCSDTSPPGVGLCGAVKALTPTETAFQADFSQSAPGACASVLTQTEACKAAADKAAFACAETLSPNIAQAASVVKMGMGLLGQMSGANDPCDGFADAMKKAGNAITAFEAACSAAKIMAETSCKTAATSATACGAELKKESTTLEPLATAATNAGTASVQAPQATAAAGATESLVAPTKKGSQYLISEAQTGEQVANLASTAESQAASAESQVAPCKVPITSAVACPAEIASSKAAGGSATAAGSAAKKLSTNLMKKSGQADALAAGLTAVSTAAGGYAMTLASAGMGLMSMMKAQGQANNCKDKTTANDCSKNPSAPGCGGAASPNVDCSGRDVNSSICVCAANPRQAGCDKTLAGTQFGHLVQKKPGVNTDMTAPALPGAPALAPEASSSATTAGGGGGGGSGKGGLGGGGGLGGSGADKSKSTAKGSESTAGAGGFGSGGGGSSGRGGSGYVEGKYDKYLPGGKEAVRGLAGAGEVTGKMGKSNWDKIHDRYRDNVPKLKVEGR